MARNIDRPNAVEFPEAKLIMSSTDTDGMLPSGLAGEYQIFVSTYVNDVEFQQRVAAVVDDDGTEVTAATEWRTQKTFDSAVASDVRLTKNFEYRVTTSGVGSVVHLDVQWDAVS